ncbi:MAG: hypothetical protein ABSB29_03465 [Nitrososphaerales archaeon]|jgi:hypothetical protein
MSLPNTLVGQSNLTEKQLESLLSYVKVVAGEIRLREAAALRSEKPVTIGSYYRTVQQGRKRIRESVVTVLVAIAIGLVRLEDARRLFELVGKGSAEVAEDDRERFTAILQVLLDKIVM